ncbi:MAG: hypothetical protein H0V88_09295 [Pyrinomonadaceae bacterium]|nr:hypothetical protein [Pyrinomonadaceae bacterium]
MSEAGTPEAPSYLWYQAGNWTDLEQGDLLPNCPVLVPPSNLTEVFLTAKDGDEFGLEVIVQRARLIVMSQSCDLAAGKIDQVLLCAHFPASNHPKNIRSEIRKERYPALHMIEKCELPNHEFERQIIDFRTIYTLPKDFVLAFSGKLGKRVRLLSPYKEHLSQAFARYFMRVGLPRPLRDE